MVQHEWGRWKILADKEETERLYSTMTHFAPFVMANQSAFSVIEIRKICRALGIIEEKPCSIGSYLPVRNSTFFFGVLRYVFNGTLNCCDDAIHIDNNGVKSLFWDDFDYLDEDREVGVAFSKHLIEPFTNRQGLATAFILCGLNGATTQSSENFS